MSRNAIRSTSSVSRRVALGGVGAAAAMAGLNRVSTVRGHEGGSDLAAHPLVGAWRVANDPAEPNSSEPAEPAYYVFHADGTALASTAVAGVGVGVWRPTGERTADRSVWYVDLDPDPNHLERGAATGSTSVTVAESGTTFTETGTVQGKAIDGTVLFTFPSINIGTRLEVEPMAQLDTAGMVTPAVSTPTN
jgi:hypothetical protein